MNKLLIRSIKLYCIWRCVQVTTFFVHYSLVNLPCRTCLRALVLRLFVLIGNISILWYWVRRRCFTINSATSFC